MHDINIKSVHGSYPKKMAFIRISRLQDEG